MADVAQPEIGALPVADFAWDITNRWGVDQPGLCHQQRHQNRHKAGRHMDVKFQSAGQWGIAEFHQQRQRHHGHGLPFHALHDRVVQGIESHHHRLLARPFGNTQGQRQLL